MAIGAQKSQIACSVVIQVPVDMVHLQDETFSLPIGPQPTHFTKVWTAKYKESATEALAIHASRTWFPPHEKILGSAPRRAHSLTFAPSEMRGIDVVRP